MRDMEVRYSDLRKDKGLKQSDIAKVLNVSRESYTKCERCINDMSLDKCVILANFYKVSLDYLLGLNDNDESVYHSMDTDLMCKRLQLVRKERGVTQEQISKEIGCSQQTYSDYEKGIYMPTAFKIYYIGIYFGVSLDYLVGRSDEKSLK